MTLFLILNSIIVVVMVLPALFLIKEKPPSPPSMVTTKKRPVQTLCEAAKELIKTQNYIYVFLYFNIINNISIFNSEIEGFTAPYGYTLFEYTTGSMVNCVAGIACSIYVGKLLDKYRNYKNMQIYVGIACFLALLLTYLILEFNLPNFLGIAMSILGGGPVSSISCVSYQFAAEVSYPVSEVQSVSLMNIVSKLLTFGFS